MVAAKAWRQGSHPSVTRSSCLDKLEALICPRFFGAECLRHVLVKNVQKGKKAWHNQVSKEKGPVVNV